MVDVRLRFLNAHLRAAIWPRIVGLKLLIRAAIEAPGITLTVLAALFPFALPLLRPLRWEGLIPAASLLAISLFTSGWIALRAADPQTYARVVIAGRPAKEVLFAISKRIAHACRKTLRQTERVAQLAQRLENKTTAVGFEAFQGGSSAESVGR